MQQTPRNILQSEIVELNRLIRERDARARHFHEKFTNCRELLIEIREDLRSALEICPHNQVQEILRHQIHEITEFLSYD